MRDCIDALKALRLRQEGRSWRHIGELLAAAKGRMVAYDSESVAKAVKEFCVQRGIDMPKLDGYGT